jgi:hypothetical protein
MNEEKLPENYSKDHDPMIDARKMHGQVINAWHLSSVYPRRPLGKPQGKSSPGNPGKTGKSSKSPRGKSRPARRHPADSWRSWD